MKRKTKAKPKARARKKVSKPKPNKFFICGVREMGSLERIERWGSFRTRIGAMRFLTRVFKDEPVSERAMEREGYHVMITRRRRDNWYGGYIEYYEKVG